MRQYINLFEAKNIYGNVNISSRNLTKIPEKYDSVGGSFWCEGNFLTSLENSPRKVGGYFYCQYNKLITLTGSPKIVGKSFWCQKNQLTTLEGGPETVGWNYLCHSNQLTSLKGVPKKVGENFDCLKNPNLTPWEMRYILFTDLGGDFVSDHKEVNNLVNEFMQLTPEEKQDQIHEYMARLKEMR